MHESIGAERRPSEACLIPPSVHSGMHANWCHSEGPWAKRFRLSVGWWLTWVNGRLLVLALACGVPSARDHQTPIPEYAHEHSATQKLGYDEHKALDGASPLVPPPPDISEVSNATAGSNDRNASRHNQQGSEGAMVLLLRRKAEIRNGLSAFLTDAMTPRSAPKNLLDEAIKRAAAQNVTLRESVADPTDVASGLEDLAQKLRDKIGAVDATAGNDMSQFVTQIDELRSEFTSKESVAKDLADAHDFALDGMKKELRKGQLRNRYEVNEVPTTLNTGGFVMPLAKLVAPGLDQLGQPIAPVDPETFCDKSPALFSSNDGLSGKILSLITKATPANMNEKLEHLAAGFARKPRWKGAMASCPMVTPVEVEEEHHVLRQNHAGASPWLLRVRRACLRFGPANLPLPGVASFIKALSDGCRGVLFDIEPILKSRITLTDMMSTFETESGSQYLATATVQQVNIPSGSAVWVPFGRIFVPLSWDRTEKLAESSYLFVPYCVGALYASAPLEVMRAVAETNEDHLERQRTDQVWADRANLLIPLFYEPESYSQTSRAPRPGG